MVAESKNVGVDLGLTDDEKKELRQIARSVIESKTRGKPAPALSTSSNKLSEKRGAFVSLYKKGMLRGCIGSLKPEKALYIQVGEMADAAAFRDPRFRAMTEEELPYLELEISVLTPLTEIQDPNEVEVGKHGILIRKGVYSGILLPQVATERNWHRITFLEQTCRKAGLPPDAWKDPEAQVYVFSADVF